eukprot:3200548-Pyramimonas_sp.AAC.1
MGVYMKRSTRLAWKWCVCVCVCMCANGLPDCRGAGAASTVPLCRTYLPPSERAGKLRLGHHGHGARGWMVHALSSRARHAAPRQFGR